ncbi:MAG: glycosyltransferase [Candidatus Aenigmatarchaeota archaeon]
MKVLHVIPSYEPAWRFGGTVTATSNLCRALAKKGIDVTVYTTDADGKGGYLDVPLNEPLDLGGVKVWYFHCDLLPKDAFYSRGLAKKLKETVKDFDIVHVSAIWQWIQVNVYKACKKQNKPYIVTPHSSLMNYAFKFGPKLNKKIYWKLFGKKTIKKASAIHFLCEGEREGSRSLCKDVTSFILPNGIDVNKFKRENKKGSLLRDKLGIPQEAIVLLFLGRIHPKKQIEYIIKSIPEILKYKKDVFFLIVGPIEDENYYNKLKVLLNTLKVSSNVIWIGSVKNEEVIEYYCASNIMVLPSIVEGISMAAIEAMCASLPLLVSNRVANWHEIEEDKAGVIVNPNFAEVCEALLRLCLNPELIKRLSINARKSAEKRYDINKVADLMIKAYEDVLTGRRSPELKWEKF